MQKQLYSNWKRSKKGDQICDGKRDQMWNVKRWREIKCEIEVEREIECEMERGRERSNVKWREVERDQMWNGSKRERSNVKWREVKRDQMWNVKRWREIECEMERGRKNWREFFEIETKRDIERIDQKKERSE